MDIEREEEGDRGKAVRQRERRKGGEREEGERWTERGEGESNHNLC